MIAPAVRSAGALAGVWLLVLCAAVPAAEPEVSSEERQRAERLAAEAQAAEEAGRHREATRLMQRAVRLDPARLEDRRRVVAWLEPIEPLAAIRHADRMLEVDARFGFENPTQLMRLRTLAREMQTIESSPIAARLSRRLIDWGSRKGRLKPHQLANEWLAVGTEYCKTLDYEPGSQAFDRFQRLALTHSDEIVRGGASWGVIAAIHLEAGHTDRALVAIGLLTDNAGETYETRGLQARTALALGEPLAAIEHAERAVELAGDQIPHAVPERSPYPVLVEAYRAVNQGGQAIEALEEIRASRPQDTALTIALAEQLAGRDRRDEAWDLMRAEVGLLLNAAESAPTDGASVKATRRIRERRRRLGEAFVAWSALARSAERAEAVLALAPAVLDRLEGTIDLSDAFERFTKAPEVRGVLKDWLAEPIAEENPAGRARAGVAVALAAGDESAAARILKRRLERMRRSGADQAEIDAEFFDAYYALLNRGEADASVGLMRWMRDASHGVAGVQGEERRQRETRMALELAVVISRSLPEEPEARAEGVAEVIGLTAQASRDLPDAFEPALNAYYALRACDADRAIVIGERILVRWPTPYAGGEVDPVWHRDLVNSLARKRQARGAAGDSERVIELDELLLDQNPSDDRALNNLAYEYALQGRGLALAERMARRAVELEPDDPNYYDTQGWALFKLGRLGAARAVLAEGLGRVEETTPQEIVDALREHLAAVDRALGLAEEAEAAP